MSLSESVGQSGTCRGDQQGSVPGAGLPWCMLGHAGKEESGLEMFEMFENILFISSDLCVSIQEITTPSSGVLRLQQKVAL